MSAQNDGGPAFPGQPKMVMPSGSAIVFEQCGMSLRDWLAGQNMAAMLGGISGYFYGDERHLNPVARKQVVDHIAKIAAEAADAMIAALEAKP